MTLLIINPDDAAWRERAEKAVAMALCRCVVDECHVCGEYAECLGYDQFLGNARVAVTALLSTIQPVDEAAVERAAEAAFNVIDKAQTQTFGSQWTSLGDAEDAVRAAIAALGKPTS